MPGRVPTPLLQNDRHGFSSVSRGQYSELTLDKGVVYVGDKPLWHEEKSGTLVPASEAHLREMRRSLGSGVASTGGQPARGGAAGHAPTSDVPTSALDPELVGEVLKVIQRLTEEHDLTKEFLHAVLHPND